MSDPVHAQYEAYPYPPRDPRDEAKRLIVGSPSHLLEIDHYVFGGRLDRTRPFRALIAGGGTGDGAIMLAQQLADAGSPAEIVHLDLSQAARRVAEARAAARGLTNLRFVTGSLLELPALGLGPFDYIDCCGVLHHLDDPAAGLAALVGALTPQGGLGVMLYGELGRIGVYHAQAMLRMLAPDGPAAGRIALARKLLAQLPQTNWFRRNPGLSDHVSAGDAGIHDLLLHARDRAYRVPEVEALAAAAGLRIVSFIEPCRYDPASYLGDPALLQSLATLTDGERRAFAELLAGNFKSHIFYAVRADNPVSPPSPHDPDAIPALRNVDAAALARSLEKDLQIRASGHGLAMSFPVPGPTPAIVRRIDGRRSLRAIQAALAAATGLDRAGFAAVFAELCRPLNGLNLLLLRVREDSR